MENLIITELKNRIGILVAQYEEKLAHIKAEATTIINSKDEEINKLRSELSDGEA